MDPSHLNPNFRNSFLNLGKSVEHHFHAARQQQQQQPQHLYFKDSQQPIPHFYNLRLPPPFNRLVPKSPPFVPLPLPATPIFIAPVQQLIPNSSSNLDPPDFHLVTSQRGNAGSKMNSTRTDIFLPCDRN